WHCSPICGAIKVIGCCARLLSNWHRDMKALQGRLRARHGIFYLVLKPDTACSRSTGSAEESLSRTSLSEPLRSSRRSSCPSGEHLHSEPRRGTDKRARASCGNHTAGFHQKAVSVAALAGAADRTFGLCRNPDCVAVAGAVAHFYSYSIPGRLLGRQTGGGGGRAVYGRGRNAVARLVCGA